MSTKATSGPPVWLEYAKLAVAALIPIAVVYLGLQIDRGKAINQELVRKKIDLYTAVAPKLNEIYVFSQGIGRWRDLDPTKLISNKRDIDLLIYVNRFLLSDQTFGDYRQFENAFFALYQEPGKDAAVKVDIDFLRMQIGGGFKDAWLPSLSSTPGARVAQNSAYETIMKALAEEVKGQR